MPIKSACLLIAVALTMNGCTQAMTGVGYGELARLREQSEVLAVHYEAPPPAFLVWKKGEGTGRAVTAGVASAVVLLPAMLLVPPLRMVPDMVVHGVKTSAAESLGGELAREIALEDPIMTLKERAVSRLAAETEMTRIRSVAVAGGGDLERLKHVLGVATVFDVTTGWQLRHHLADPATFFVLYQVQSRLIRLDQGKVVWQAEVTCGAGDDRRFGFPTLEELRADGGALLKASIARAAQICGEALVARFRSQEATRPAPSPGVDVTVEPSTLAEAEAKLLGPAGLVAGSVRFDAKFKGVALTAQNLPQLRTIMKDATASPWGSEVQFRGTIDGARFKATMDKGSSGRVEFGFEGLHFDDEARARAFLAPLQGRGVREVKLRGLASGRPITIELTPTGAWPAGLPNVEGGTSTTVDLPLASVGSLAATAPARPSAPPGALKWPPADSSYVLSERKSGSYGSAMRQRTVRYLGEQTWRGKKALAFSDGSVTTYVDARRRILARVKDGAPVESFEPYFTCADWPLFVGKSWPNHYRYYDHTWGLSFDGVRYDGKVEAFEDVRTPAGTFTAFKIALEGASSNVVLWYSSDLGLVVKMRAERFPNHYLGAGMHETDLVSYDFKP